MNKSNSYAVLIESLEQRVLAGEPVRRAEALMLMDCPHEHLLKLLAAADAVRIHYKGDVFDACSLINARSGRCGEDCAFCAQSSHYNSTCETYGLRSEQDILDAARNAKEHMAGRFCTVTSGGALSQREFEALMKALDRVRREVDIPLDASLGFLDTDRVEHLKQAGVTRYNHNLEASEDYYSKICTTHRFEQRVQTVRTVLESDLSACSGGIIGMGESKADRVDLAMTLARLGVDCVPVNILDPRPNTPLAGTAPLAPMEILTTIAVFRLILPQATIKVAGGRERNLRDFQAMALRAGANGMIIGGYLTTKGRSVEDDLRMIREAGYVI